MKIDRMNLELDSFVENANVIKNQVILTLLDKKVIPEETANEYLDKWVIVIFKNAWYIRWWKKFHESESTENDWSYKFVKIQD